jgi:hypothetical protein
MFHRGPACPVPADAARWVHDSLDWCLHQFGADLMRGPVLLPDASFFPHEYTGSAADIQEIIHTVAARMGADPAALDPAGDDTEPRNVDPVSVREMQALPIGLYDQQERSVAPADLDEGDAPDPISVVAIVAHQLAQVRLVGERRIEAGRHDRDQLCDLATVFLGLGVFGANAALSFSHGPEYNAAGMTPRMGDWSARRVGYLGEELFGFTLACYARLRDEPDPAWVRALDTNPRVYMKRASKYLTATGGTESTR